MPPKSNFVENMNKFVLENIKDKLNDKNKEIVIPSQLRKKDDWNKRFIGSLIKCFHVNGIEKYMKDYFFSIDDKKLMIKANQQKKSLEELMIDFVKIVITKPEENTFKIPRVFSKNLDKFLRFFIKIVATHENEYFQNHSFKVDENKLIISDKAEILEKHFNKFILDIEKELSSILDDDEKYKKFNGLEYTIPHYFNGFDLKKNIFEYFEKNNVNLKNKFRFNFKKNVINIEFNHCLNIFCNNKKCTRCHFHHQFGKFSELYQFMDSLKDGGICLDCDKTVVYSSNQEEENIVKMIDKRSDFYTTFSLKDKIFDYSMQITKQLIKERREMKRIEMEEQNICFNENYLRHQMSFEDLIYDYVQDENMMLYIDNKDRELHIKFNYWYDFKKKLSNLFREHFPPLLKEKSKKETKKLYSEWNIKLDWFRVGQNKWIYIADEDFEEEEDEFECIQLIPLFSEINDGIKRVCSGDRMIKLLNYECNTPPLSPFDVQSIRECPTPTFFSMANDVPTIDEIDYDFRDSSYLEMEDDSFSLSEHEEEDEIKEKVKKLPTTPTRNISEIFKNTKKFKSITI